MRRFLSIAGAVLGISALAYFAVTSRQMEFRSGSASAVNAIRYDAPIKLAFTGDIMLSRGVDAEMQRADDFRFPFLSIADYLRSFDLVFGNLEGPISDRGENQGSIYSFRAEPDSIKGLTYAGFKAVSVANNHIFDWGPLALADTIQILKDNDIDPVGAGRNESEANQPYVADIRGTKIGFLAYTDLYPQSSRAFEADPGLSDFRADSILEAVRRLKAKTDIVVVSFHWGVEYATHSNAHQEELAHELVDAGADLVIGTHPHVPEEVERYKNSWIAYSLGNFVFDQGFSKETMGGIIGVAEIKDKHVESFQTVPISMNSKFQPELSLPEGN